MKIGLIGLAGSGKTTVFNAVTGLDATIGSIGGDRTRPNLGMARVPDARVDRLSEMYTPKKTIYSEVTFVDLPGRLPGSGEGGLDPLAVQHIQDMDALTLVIRAFDNPILSEAQDALRDVSAFEDELLLTDMVVLEGRVNRLRKPGKGDPELKLLERCLEAIEEGQPLRQISFSPEEERQLSGYRFLTQKPAMVLYSAGDDDVGQPPPGEFSAECETRKLPVLAMAGRVEMEIAQLDEEEQGEFLADLGLEAGARDRFIRATYDLLDRICFLTVGPDEVRSWEIRRGTVAVKAAGKVHSDIERGFIRAEVMSYEDLVTLGSEQACKEKGKARLEGKTYVMQDGDVVDYRFNV